MPGLWRRVRQRRGEWRCCAPEPGPDGLTLFGGFGGIVGWVSRNSPGDPFDPQITELQSKLDLSGAPHVSSDCRRLYFIGLNNSAGVVTFGIYVASR